jgi:hypothetical protein
VYLVPEGELNRLPGSRDERLLAAILRQKRQAIREFDEQYADTFWEEGEEKPLSPGDAVAELIAGKCTRPEDYPVYDAAREMLCGHLGEELSNSGFCPCSIDLYKTLDRELSGRGIPLRLMDLIGNRPISFPDRDGDCLIGHWSAEEMGRAEPLLAAALAANPPSGSEWPGGKDGPLHPTLPVVHGWLQKAVRQPGSMLVGFHS